MLIYFIKCDYNLFYRQVGYRGDFLKVLILTVSAGSGHIEAAKAIDEHFKKNYSDVETLVVDTLKYINPFIDKIIIGSYMNTVKKTPVLYAKLYDYAENEEAVTNISEKFNDVMSTKLISLIEDFLPDIILCTHPFPIEMLSILKRKNKIDVPVIGLLTDYAVHSYWLYNYIDYYVIANEDFKQDMIRRGVNENIILPFGIPVSDEFLKDYDKNEVRKSLGLDPEKLTLLIMGGGCGIGNIKNIFEILQKSPLDFQSIICTGKNSRLKKQIEKISKTSNKKALVLGFTDEVSKLMSISDILITKPGGLTIAEALIKKIPIIISSAIPGQEERNSDYLLNNGLAARVKGSQNILSVLKQVTDSKERIKYMQKMAYEKSKPYAARDLCHFLYNMQKKDL
jgi:processive 1,2-diacylglycerol beta-glucosyltransferase